MQGWLILLDIYDLRRMIYKPLGLIGDGASPVEQTGDDQLSLDEVDLYLNRSFWEIMSKFKFREKERLATFQTTIGERNYTVPAPFEAIRNLSIAMQDQDGTLHQHTPLGQILANTYEERYNEKVENRGFPSHYVREGCLIKLWPTPDAVYTITMRRWITIQDITTSNTYPDVPQEWGEIIGLGGLWRAAIDFREFNLANFTKSHQVSLINTTPETETKEKDANPALFRLDVSYADYGSLRSNPNSRW